jgi:hypothetical protein
VVEESKREFWTAIAYAICADESGARPHPYLRYAVRVKSRFEFTTSAVLDERGYETFFLPIAADALGRTASKTSRLRALDLTCLARANGRCL